MQNFPPSSKASATRSSVTRRRRGTMLRIRRRLAITATAVVAVSAVVGSVFALTGDHPRARVVTSEPASTVEVTSTTDSTSTTIADTTTEPASTVVTPTTSAPTTTIGQPVDPGTTDTTALVCHDSYDPRLWSADVHVHAGEPAARARGRPVGDRFEQRAARTARARGPTVARCTPEAFHVLRDRAPAGGHRVRGDERGHVVGDRVLDEPGGALDHARDAATG